MNNLGLVTKYEVGFLEHVLPHIWVRTENIITLVHSLTDLTNALDIHNFRALNLN